MTRFTKYHFLFISFLICSTYIKIGFSTTYYISVNGNDTHQGSRIQPWKTIAKANKTVQSGDTVFVRQGMYHEDINPVHSGTSENPIVYKKYKNEKVEIKGVGSGGEEAVVAIGYPGSATSWGSKSWIVVDGFIINPTNARYGLVIYGNNSYHNIIRNCEIINEIGGKRDGILIGSAKYTLIENNLIDGNWRLGIITTQSPKYTVIKGNQIQNMRNSGIDIQTSYGNNQAMLIEENVITGSKIEDGIQFEPDYSGYDPGTKRGVIIRNNVICNHAENAIDLKGSAFVVIEKNLIWGNRGDNNGSGNLGGGVGGIMKGDITNTQAHNILIRKNILYDNFGGISIHNYNWIVVHNTIIGNNRCYLGSDISAYQIENAPGDYCRRLPGLAGVKLVEPHVSDFSGCVIKNNIIGGHHQGEIAVRTTANIDQTEIDGNCYINDGDVIFNNVQSTWNWEKLNFAEYKNSLQTNGTSKSYEENSILSDYSVFNSMDTTPIGDNQFDFSLAPTSQAIDKGLFLTHTISSGQGQEMVVENASLFSDGYEIVAGDQIMIESNGKTAIIKSIDYDQNKLNLDRSISWIKGDGIAYIYSGAKPDIGALELDEYKIEIDKDNELYATIELGEITMLGEKKIEIILKTSKEVKQIPGPAILRMHNGSEINVFFEGSLPGTTFIGTLYVTNSLAEGSAQFYLPDRSLVSLNGQTNNLILNGGTITIDQTPPIQPSKFNIK